VKPTKIQIIMQAIYNLCVEWVGFLWTSKS
jgi:hypothetical protein